MATLLELEQHGDIFRFDPSLAWNEYEDRRVYMLPRARKWIEEKLPLLESVLGVQESPQEQLDALFYEFCSGQRLQTGRRFKKIRPRENGVWELKTADLRVFGWFCMKDCFVVTACNDATATKDHNLYRGYCDEAVRLRNALDIDEPKYVSGDDPNDVVSDCY
jgi:hypothetical protein